ncbi:release factor glutamine methyltransferase [Ktedonobacteria bacterium brp13]|nr:release factor glutamine methyltransferase [Ktedonobacteria bacterium brp13]
MALTLEVLWRRGTEKLTRSKIIRPRLDAQVLLSAVTGLDRAQLMTYPEREATEQQVQQFRTFIQRRSDNEPIAYILNNKEFYRLDFFVDQRVLIPRPDTEMLVEQALGIIEQRIAVGETPLVADIGTGSGAIPIAIAVNEPRLPRIYACDVSPDALAVARINSERHNVADRVFLLNGNLVEPLPETVDILLANLPYVGTGEVGSMSRDVLAYEPHLALFSGPHGLDLLYQLCEDIQQSGTLKDRGVILLEIGYQQSELLTPMLKNLWPTATVSSQKDYAGWNRLIQVCL